MKKVIAGPLDLEVKITYKSGKVEVAIIPMLEYGAAVVSLTKEGRLVSMEIL